LTDISRIAVGLAALAAALTVGCNGKSLPTIEADQLNVKLREIPQAAAPVFEWHGECKNWPTYWGRQAMVVGVRGHIPETWSRPGDAFWQVDARNHEGKPLPFIGLLLHYTNANGTRLAKVAPELNLAEVPDGLYVIIDPRIERNEDGIVSIRPNAHVMELRDHVFKGGRVKIPLNPLQDSPVTPPAEPLPEEPRGTPIPTR